MVFLARALRALSGEPPNLSIRHPVLLATARCRKCEHRIDEFRPVGITIGDGNGRPIMWCADCLRSMMIEKVRDDRLRRILPGSTHDQVCCSRCSCNNFSGKVVHTLHQDPEGSVQVCTPCCDALLH